ncbi:MAG: hypothetical protein ACHP7P_17065, partial [Terriglobales bacterium]
RHLKVLGVALVAIFAFGITATSAFALPDVHLALGEAYPLHLNFADNGATPTELQSTGGGVLKGKGLLVLFLGSELSALGRYEALFLNVTLKGESCNSEGDKTGEVLTTGDYHIVWLTLKSDPAKALTIGVAFLVLPDVVVKCGKLEITVTGCALGSIEGENAADVTKVTGKLESDKKGKNLLTKYYNNEGKLVGCILLSAFGKGLEFLQSSEAVGEAVPLEALESKMFTILNI